MRLEMKDAREASRFLDARLPVARIGISQADRRALHDVAGNESDSEFNSSDTTPYLVSSPEIRSLKQIVVSDEYLE
jgi:hypothetical protein